MNVEYDYLENTPPVHNESLESGNGNADEYLSTPESGNVPAESKLSLEEQRFVKNL